MEVKNRPLLRVPLIRRIEYLSDYLQALDGRCRREEIEEILSERKRSFEKEKILAVGRGNPFRRNIERTSNLTKECLKLAQTLEFVYRIGDEVKISEKGREFLDSTESRKILFAEAYSKAYPHLATLALALSELDDKEAILPLHNKPEFRPEAEKIGLSIGQVAFDVIRDISTSLGIVNWYCTGKGIERRQHVYLASTPITEPPVHWKVRLHLNGGWLFIVPSVVERGSFRDALWSAYLEVANGIPGSPVFYTAVREKVCTTLRICDEQFDGEVLRMVESDDVFSVIWSEGVLPYQRDSASMLKSLPPKNEDGKYIVYLKMVWR